MRLYIANVTRQYQNVFYRLDFFIQGNAAQRSSGLKQISIAPGQQVTVGGDLTLDQAQTIMDQLSPYGGLGVEEISRIPNVKIAYLMSLDKPVPAKLIRLLDEHNRERLTGEGDERRRNAAIAAHPGVDEKIDGLKLLDIEMLEIPPGLGDPEPVGKPLDFGVHLDKNARETNAKRPSGRRGKRATG